MTAPSMNSSPPVLTAFQFIPILSPLPVSLPEAGPRLIGAGSASSDAAVDDVGHVDAEVTDGAHDAPDLLVETEGPPQDGSAGELESAELAAPSGPLFFDATEGTSRAAALRAIEEMDVAALSSETRDYWWWQDRLKEVRIELERRR
jgi:hypothetical protein